MQTDKPIVKIPAPVFGYRDKFESLELLVGMIIAGACHSAFIFGTPGVGKTFRIERLLKRFGSLDYLWVKGTAKPMGLYTLLYENRTSLIILDDCDGAFADGDSKNILNAALDDKSSRVVSYYSKAVVSAGMPQHFDFKGAIIFVSNLRREQVNEAILSRSKTVEFDLSANDMLELMREILPLVAKEKHSHENEAEEVMTFLEENASRMSSCDLRTLGHALEIRRFGDNWKRHVWIMT